MKTKLTCKDCQGPISTNSKSGYCRACHNRLFPKHSVPHSEETKKKISIDNKLNPRTKNLGLYAVKNAMSKDKSPKWKGGITKENKLLRIKFLQEFQKKIFERDNYTCQLCSARGVHLQIDHIQKWSEYVEGRFNIKNCRTLCVKCHYKITYNKPMPDSVKTWGLNLKNFNAGRELPF